MSEVAASQQYRSGRHRSHDKGYLDPILAKQFAQWANKVIGRSKDPIGLFAHRGSGSFLCGALHILYPKKYHLFFTSGLGIPQECPADLEFSISRKKTIGKGDSAFTLPKGLVVKRRLNNPEAKTGPVKYAGQDNHWPPKKLIFVDDYISQGNTVKLFDRVSKFFNIKDRLIVVMDMYDGYDPKRCCDGVIHRVWRDDEE